MTLTVIEEIVSMGPLKTARVVSLETISYHKQAFSELLGVG